MVVQLLSSHTQNNHIVHLNQRDFITCKVHFNKAVFKDQLTLFVWVSFWLSLLFH